MHLLAASDRAEQRWRNGGGITAEVARSSDGSNGQPLWRIAVATIASDGDFSEFPGIDRHLMPLGPDPLALRVDDAEVVVPLRGVLSFRGEAHVRAVQVDRAGQDLNVMVARGHHTATLRELAVSPGLGIAARADEITMLLALDADLAARDHNGRTWSLDTLDAVQLDPGQRVTAASTGAVAVIRIRSTTD